MGNICRCNKNEFDEDSIIIDSISKERFNAFLLYSKIKKLEEKKLYHIPIWPDKNVKYKKINFFI